MADPFGYLLECHEKYGDVFRLPLPGLDIIVAAHPDLAVEVLHDRGDRFGLPRIPGWVEKSIGGVPFPALDGDRYAERRSIVTPMFGKRFLARLADSTVERFAESIASWDRFADSGEVVDLEHELSRVTLDGFLRQMFSMTITDSQFARYHHDLRAWLAGFVALTSSAPARLLFPIPGTTNMPISMARMEREIADIVDRRLADPQPHHDLLQVLVEGRLKDGTPLRRRELLHDACGLMTAGYETVVAATCWTLALLPTNPEARRRLIAEIDQLDGARPSAGDLDRLGYAKACFDEGQRMQGHTFNLPRIAKDDTELAGFRIRKGQWVAVSNIAMYRDRRWWANPYQFDPEHFADKAQVAARPRTAFIPFGTGPHQCVGMAMAYMNAQFLLSLILQRYDINCLPGWEPRRKSSGSTTIEGGFPCTITRR
jgi:cytochrome P450